MAENLQLKRVRGLMVSIMARVNPSDKPVERFAVAMGFGSRGRQPGKSRAPAMHCLQAHWPETLITPREAFLGAGTRMWSDNISLPLENPWKRNIRFADIAFFRNGKAAAVTFRWRASG